MSGCCKPGDFDGIFNEGQARADARKYRGRGLGGQSRWILDAFAGHVADRTVLEVGGGVGALQIELLRAGATQATNVELSPGYEGVAHDLLAERDLVGRVDRRIADFVAEESRVPDADLVMLDRVVCCYPDPAALVGAAARHTREMLALTFPVERPYMRIGRALINLWPRITRSRFRFFVHASALVIATAEASGLHVTARRHGFVWQLLVFSRHQR